MSLDPEKKEFGAWWMWVLGLTVITVIALAGLNAAGMLGRTVVEREVFENSYQYTAAQKQKIATIEAQIAEVQQRLTSPDLDPAVRSDLEAQAAGLRVQLHTAQAVSQ
jgi:hypothetical protein